MGPARYNPDCTCFPGHKGTWHFSTVDSCLSINCHVVFNVWAATDVCVNMGTRGGPHVNASRINSAVNLCFASDLAVIK